MISALKGEPYPVSRRETAATPTYTLVELAEEVGVEPTRHVFAPQRL